AQKAALEDDVGPAQPPEEAHALPPTFRQREQLKEVAHLPEVGREGRQAVAAGDVTGRLDQADPVHAGSSEQALTSRPATAGKPAPVPAGAGAGRKPAA